MSDPSVPPSLETARQALEIWEALDGLSTTQDYQTAGDALAVLVTQLSDLLGREPNERT